MLPEVGSRMVCPGSIAPLRLGVLDHVLGDSVLDGARRVAPLELRPEADLRLGPKARQLDQRGVADRLEYVLEVAAAGTIEERLGAHLLIKHTSENEVQAGWHHAWGVPGGPLPKPGEISAQRRSDIVRHVPEPQGGVTRDETQTYGPDRSRRVRRRHGGGGLRQQQRQRHDARAAKPDRHAATSTSSTDPTIVAQVPPDVKSSGELTVARGRDLSAQRVHRQGRPHDHRDGCRPGEGDRPG